MARPTLEELQDRFEIDELLTRYATAIDGRDFDLLDTVFTPDAHLDYISAGGIAGDMPTVKAWLAEVLPMFPAYQHLVGNRRVTLDGDAATSVAVFHNPMALGDGTMFFCGGEYHDRLVRTPEGWRITERVEQTAYSTGPMPATKPAPPA
ncbi:MAG: nuclear transport factor 2 family protein [Actinomycetota bacterium]